MLTNEVERGKIKCYKYWPDNPSEFLIFDTIRVTLEKEQVSSTITIREITLKSPKGSRSIKHIQYTEWPDHGVPDSRNSFLDLIPLCQSNSNGGPIVVHCSAGLGRTGSFILVDSILKKVQEEKKRGKTEDNISINLPATLIKMRYSRPLLVQTEV